MEVKGHTQYEAKDLNGSIVIPRWIIPVITVFVGAFITSAIWGLNIMMAVQQDIATLKSDGKRIEQLYEKVEKIETKLIQLEYDRRNN